ncbi:CLUMA_CG020600, isoform A [Clunio marinus]|uniref:CLUMA_CG020600, isoform A n=1 Tax=Clunio marinus TaxID=568069 RepID=A0A1J1J782_9DIPT|nr:CLUMA_CG020600, isoform A [Clunio marinus]
MLERDKLIFTHLNDNYFVQKFLTLQIPHDVHTKQHKTAQHRRHLMFQAQSESLRLTSILMCLTRRKILLKDKFNDIDSCWS